MLQARQNEDTKAPGGKIQEEPSFQHGLPGDGRQAAEDGWAQASMLLPMQTDLGLARKSSKWEQKLESRTPSY